MDVSHCFIARRRKKEICQAEQLHTRAPGGSPQGPDRGSSKACMDFLFFFFFSFLFGVFPEGTTSLHLLEKAGDVVFAAGRPGEGVGVGGDVGGHQFGCLVAFGTAGIPDPVVVHPKTERHKMNLYHTGFAAKTVLQEAKLRGRS